MQHGHRWQAKMAKGMMGNSAKETCVRSGDKNLNVSQQKELEIGS